MDFDLDDPLGDLLSDGSNDSFFGTATKKKQTKTDVDTKLKPKVADLFSIEPKKSDEIESTITKSTLIQTKNDSTVPTTSNRIKSETPTFPVKTTKANEILKSADESIVQPKKEIKFDDSDDFLNELGFDPKNPKGNLASTKKANILDDILNFSKVTTEPTPPQTKPLTPVAKTVKEVEKKSNETSAPRYSPSLGRPRNVTRNASSSSTNDPLGFFSTPTKKSQIKEKEEVVASKPKITKKPSVDWLGLNEDNETDQLKEVIPPAPRSTDNIETIKEDIPQNATNPNIQNLSSMSKNTELNQPSPMLLNFVSIENERTLSTLQQQESQLKMAAQMKQQENILLDLQTKQKSLLKQQENQFNQLLQRQIDRQNQLELQIQQQQQQINAYINVLLTQPNAGPLNALRISDNHEIRNSDNEITATKERNHIELEAELRRLDLEKLRLEDVLQSVQSSHEQELDLLHTSHKKQVGILEENLKNLEQRFRTEINSIENHHTEKCNVLVADMEAQQRKYDDQIKKLINDYEKQIEKLRTNYEAEVELLKIDQRATTENIRQMKLYEFAAMHESSSYLNTLKSASDNLETANDNLQTMRINIDSSIERIHAEREIQLSAKEKRLNEQQTTIDKMVERTETERTRLIELVRSLEIKLNSIEQSSAEEQWSLRQKSATLDAERKSFEREKEFMREKQAIEENRIQEMKEIHFAEHKRLMDSIDAERQQILVEKAKLETMERLKAPKDSTNQRQNELDAAIRIAQDAAMRADTEREKLVELQQKLEFRKRELIDKETHLQSKQSEMELCINQAKDQKRTAEQVAKSCKILEQKFLTKLRSLQENFVELTNREMKLSQAKMELSKERMTLQNYERQLRQTKCSLCRIGAQNRDLSEQDPLNDITMPGRFTSKLISTNPNDEYDSGLPNVDDLLANDARIDIPLVSPRKWNLTFMEAIDDIPNVTAEADLLIEKLSSI